MNPVVEASVERLVQSAIALRRDKGTGLHTKVGARHIDDGDPIADGLKEAFQVGQGDLALLLKDGVHIVGAGDGAHIPLGHVADALGVFQPGGGDGGNVAKGRSRELAKERLVRLGVEALGGRPIVSYFVV